MYTENRKPMTGIKIAKDKGAEEDRTGNEAKWCM